MGEGPSPEKYLAYLIQLRFLSILLIALVALTVVPHVGFLIALLDLIT